MDKGCMQLLPIDGDFIFTPILKRRFFCFFFCFIPDLFYSNCSISSIALKISRITCGTMAFPYPLTDSCLHFVKGMERSSTSKGSPSFPLQTGD